MPTNLNPSGGGSLNWFSAMTESVMSAPGPVTVSDHPDPTSTLVPIGVGDCRAGAEDVPDWTPGSVGMSANALGVADASRKTSSPVTPVEA